MTSIKRRELKKKKKKRALSESLVEETMIRRTYVGGGLLSTGKEYKETKLNIKKLKILRN